MGRKLDFLYEALLQIGVKRCIAAYYCGPVIVMMPAPIIFPGTDDWRQAAWISCRCGRYGVCQRARLCQGQDLPGD